MINLATKNTNDFTVTESGEAFISQRKTAELCGVERNSIVHFFKDKNNISQGVSDKQLAFVVQHYAIKGRREAVQTLILFAKAGAKAYIYHQAGYKIKADNKFSIPQSMSEALMLAANQAKEIELLEEQKKIDAPKVEFAMAVRHLDGSCSLGDFAKVIGTGRNKLFKLLRDLKILMVTNIPYQRFIDSGYFIVLEQTPFIDSKGKSHPAFTTRITGKGQVWLDKHYRSAFGGKAEEIMGN